MKRREERMISHLLTELHSVGVDNVEDSHSSKLLSTLIEIDRYGSSYDVWQTD